MKKNKSKFATFPVAIALLVAFPFFSGTYFTEIVILFFIYAILVASFRIVVITGGWDCAHIVIMGCGSYATSILAKSFALPFYVTLPVAGLSAALVGLVLSFAFKKTVGFGFFIATMVAGEAIRLIWTRMFFPFGGHRGILNIPTPNFSPIPGLQTIDFGQTIPFYFLTLVITIVCLLVMYRQDSGRLGFSFRAISSQEDLAKSIGIPIERYRSLAYAISSFFAGIAGGLFAHFVGAISPSSFSETLLLYLLVWVILGGTRTFFGPILGLGIMKAFHEILLSTIAEVDWIPLIYGGLLLMILLFLPKGVDSLPKLELVQSLVRKERAGKHSTG